MQSRSTSFRSCLTGGLRILHWRAPIYETMFAPLFSPIDASLSYAVSYTMLMFVIAWVMCTRAVFLKRKRQEYDMASCGCRSPARCRPPSVWPVAIGGLAAWGPPFDLKVPIRAKVRIRRAHSSRAAKPSAAATIGPQEDLCGGLQWLYNAVPALPYPIPNPQAASRGQRNT